MAILGPLRVNAFRPPKGQKQIFLPAFTLTLLRTPNLPATMASFLVPLNLNKLDLKDYLYHAYALRVLSVRSYIQQQRVQADRPSKTLAAPRRWFRPRAVKKMTVEMERAFVWPAAPAAADMDAWDKVVYDKAVEANEEESERLGPGGEARPRRDGASVRGQARALLDGRERWRPMWVDYGPRREVEVGLGGWGGWGGEVDVPLVREKV
ncbi:MAG: hypothetical protein FRX48_08497 [Lasallia pustulata]|uniref:Large ribosomal subunit protein uL23m n=1 Tax=Lasallia pustulata TaxID=136370 RepID=A0A5M8PE84_9LECA|nr:MAG: hypothetical protein FRX48_08497 [Lasallia pustulata]